MKISQYIPFIESTLSLTTNYTISNFKNIVNNLGLKQNRNQLLNNSLFWKTAFEIAVNFENKLIYQYVNSKSKNHLALTNESWQNTFKVIVKLHKKWVIILEVTYCQDIFC